ncbi:TlpA disulfide reductase family protein [Hyphomicrobium sp.]|uniref:TlpA family protein disulfide reductase n=1 Tax=Hyphomicrobium sp. TaxID=82 RepID=UPI000FB90DC4|nr:TlpA disulfide reductase family protein [Hyphomicrobium sp.]RUO98405.1 MAG: TlpA family protein disulfide reductase [Hyphomicrobium sp.]
MAARNAARPSRALWIVALSALLGFGAVYVIGGRFDNGGPANSGAVAQNMSAPEVGASGDASFKLGEMAAFVTKKSPEALPDITFQDAAGKEIHLSSLKGKTVLLNLWATWCGPCREEMPALNNLQKELGSDKFEVIALSLDRAGYEASRKFLDDLKANDVKLYADPTAKQGMALKLIGMPTTILINKDGLEVGRIAGEAKWDSADAKKLIQETIN